MKIPGLGRGPFQTPNLNLHKLVVQVANDSSAAEGREVLAIGVGDVESYGKDMSASAQNPAGQQVAVGRCVVCRIRLLLRRNQSAGAAGGGAMHRGQIGVALGEASDGQDPVDRRRWKTTRSCGRRVGTIAFDRRRELQGVRRVDQSRRSRSPPCGVNDGDDGDRRYEQSPSDPVKSRESPPPMVGRRSLHHIADRRGLACRGQAFGEGRGER